MTRPFVVPAPAAAATTATAAPSLYAIEEHLACLADSEALVSPEQEAEFRAEFQAALLAAATKRDAVARFLAHCESQAVLAKVEIERLKKRQAGFVAAVERVEQYVLSVILKLQPDKKGRYPKLEGKTSSFGAALNPPSVNITDDTLVPASCKTVTITMPLPVWEAALDSLDLEARRQVEDAAKRPEQAVVKALVKQALKDGPVEGARLADPAWRLVRE
jgi:hypothetical protein